MVDEQAENDGRLLRFLKEYRAPLLVLLVTVGFFLPTLLLIRAYIFADSASYYFPARTFMSSTLRSGHLPLMCRYIYAGYPLFADSESGLFYPVNLLAAMFPDIFAFNYSLFLHYLATALFTFLYVRTIGRSRVAAAFAGLAFAFGGFAIAHMGHTNIISTLAWFPLILYLVEKGMRKDSYAFFLWAGAALGIQFLAGFLFMSLVTVAVVFFYVVLYPREGRFTWPGLGRAVGMFAVFAALGVGLGMVQNLPSYELVGASTRAGGLASNLYNHNNLPPVQLITFMFPRYYGGQFNYWGSWVFVETYGYVGLLPLVLFPAALFRRSSWHARFFAVAGVVALVISFGDAGMLYRVVRLLPGFNVLKDPARFLVLVNFALVVLAAIGLDRLLDRKGFGLRATTRLVWLVTAVAALAVGGLVLMKLLARWGAVNFFTFKNFRMRSWSFFAPVILVAVVLLLLWLWRAGYFSRGLFAGLLLAFVIFEIFFGAYNVNPQVDASSVRAEPGFAQSIQQDEGTYRVALAKDPLGVIARVNYQPNMLMPFKLEDARGYTAVEPKRMTEFIKMADLRFSLSAFGAMNVRYFIANLTRVGDGWFDTNRPVYLYRGSKKVEWGVADYLASELEMLWYLRGDRPIPAGSKVATVGIETKEQGDLEFSLISKPAGSPTVQFIRTGSNAATTAYLETTDLGAMVAVKRVTVQPDPGLGDNELTVVAMNLAGDYSRPVEAGPVIYQDDGYVVWRNPEELPRAYLAGGALVAKNSKASARSLLRYDPARTIGVEEASLTPELEARLSRWGTGRGIEGKAVMVESADGRQVVRAEASAECLLVLSEAYMPGWSATVDGRHTKILPAFGALSAVYLPAGKHEVVFTYKAPGLLVGALVTLIALAAGLAALLWSWRRKRKRVLAEQSEEPEEAAPKEPAADPLDGGLSIFFPAYNDGGTIADMVSRALEVGEKHTGDLEVLVIDDGSTDRTAETADGLAASDPRVRAIHHETNRGYGGALKSGFASAGKGLVFYTDGDGQYDPAELGLLLEKRFEADVVNGYKLGRSDPLHRRVIGRVYHRVVSVLFGIRLRDVDCDFRLIRRSALDGLVLETDSGAICMELVKKMQDRGCTFTEVPVHHFERRSGRSEFFNARNLYRTLVDLMQQFWKLEVRKNLIGDRLP